MKIGVVGGGVVGHATARCFVEHGDVFVYDRNPELSTDTYEATVACDLVFVCLPTPERNGTLDTSVLDEFFGGVAGSHAAFALKSTVPIGTTDRLRERFRADVVHNPEFLTARCAATDAQIPARNVIGGPVCRARDTLVELLWDRFPGTQMIHCSAQESELIKLMCNSFFATKIAFFNEAYALADALGLHWPSVVAGVLSDGRISHAHTRVPGPAGHFGFGGTCLPKDLACFVSEVRSRGLLASVTGGALERNQLDRNRR